MSHAEEIDVSKVARQLLDPATRFGPMNKLAVKHLGPTVTLTELWQAAKSFLHHLGDMPSYRTWVRVYHTSWKKVIRFRGEKQHATCTECGRFKAWQREAASATDSEMVAKAYMAHLKGVMDDRRIDAQWRELGRNSVAFGHGASLHESGDTWLTLTVDGMDCAKFKCPRNVSSTKEFSVTWHALLFCFNIARESADLICGLTLKLLFLLFLPSGKHKSY